MDGKLASVSRAPADRTWSVLLGTDGKPSLALAAQRLPVYREPRRRTRPRVLLRLAARSASIVESSGRQRARSRLRARLPGDRERSARRFHDRSDENRLSAKRDLSVRGLDHV